MTYLAEVLAVSLGECAREVDEGVVKVLDETESGVGSSRRARGLCFVSFRVAAVSPAASVVAPAGSVGTVVRVLVVPLRADVAGSVLVGGRLAGKDSRTVRRDGLVEVGGDDGEGSCEGVEE